MPTLSSLEFRGDQSRRETEVLVKGSSLWTGFCTISVLSKPCRFRIGSIVVLTAGSLQCSRRGVPVYQSASLNPVEAPVY
jgi:hypothetical protein